MRGLLKVDSVMYRVGNLERACRFYEDTLGLRRAWEDRASAMIGFVLGESDAEIVIHTNPELPAFDCSFLVDDVAAFCDDWRRRGYQPLLEPIEVRCGKYAILVDPDGNRIPIIDLTRFGGKPKYD